MQTIQAIQVEDKVAENLRLEAEATGKSLEEIAAERLAKREWTGLGTRIARRFKDIGLTDEEHERFERASDGEPRAADFAS